MINVHFKAALRLPQIIALYIGSVLGSGILIIPGVAAEVSGPASLLAWGLMTLLVLPMALTIGLLSAKYPNAGGAAYFVSRAFNPQLGSIIGWYFLMAVVVGAPVLSLTGAGYLCTALGIGDLYRLFIAAAILFTGILTNYLGIKITSQLQIAVVLTTLVVLTVTIAGSLSKIESENFKPFMPNGLSSVGFTTTILFWCFIGWEAVSNLSEEFLDPKRNAIIAGFAALFICMAPAISYIGAVSRLAYSLAESGYAPKPFLSISSKYKTPLGGLCFLALCFIVLLAVFSTRIISLATLIQIPSAAFILTYLGACAAGVKLLRDSKFGLFIRFTSLFFSIIIFLFVKWTIVYPLIITVFWLFYMFFSKRINNITSA